MKNFIRLFLSLLLIIFFASCETTKTAVMTDTAKENHYKEKHQKEKKLPFRDWKYKGFGKALPEWLEAAYKGNLTELQKKIPVPENYKIEIVKSRGINSDQANKDLLQKLLLREDVFELYDSSWALLDEKEAVNNNDSYPYFAAAVLLVNIKTEE